MTRLGRAVTLSTSALAFIALAVPPQSTAASAPAPEATYVVVLKDSVADPRATSRAQVKAHGGTRRDVYTHALKGYSAVLTEAEAASLARDPAVRFVTRERTYSLPPRSHHGPVGCKEATGTAQCLPDWARRVNAEKSSARSGDGRGSVHVNVAVFDTGISDGQPDLDLRGGVDCLSGSPVVPGTSFDDPDGHGTEVAGVIGAKDNDIDVVGIAPGTPVWAVKVADDHEHITGSALLCGLDWVTATRTDGDPANDVTIANLSLSGPGTDDGACGTANADAVHVAVCGAVRAGVTLVAAAGNEHLDLGQRVPAAYDEVLTATAMADFDGRPGGKGVAQCYGFDHAFFGEHDDEAALEFSDFARAAEDRRHTVAAPGVCMETTEPPGSPYTWVDGTSYASPVVAGVTALCVSVGRCGTHSPARNLRTIVDDARKYNEKRPRYGFFGDPRRPIPGRYYGHLVAADRY
ncbi:S8 family serine peptidase [Streptomyces sp. NPDC026659]|uniref:S8 family serine peptidase n=1 Tax=Streptomyces sp. NPDC026659 TaxID=3155123 RepID=UPI0033C16E29